MKKYELTAETKQWLGKTLYRIRALVAFGNVELAKAQIEDVENGGAEDE